MNNTLPQELITHKLAEPIYESAGSNQPSEYRNKKTNELLWNERGLTSAGDELLYGGIGCGEDEATVAMNVHPQVSEPQLVPAVEPAPAATPKMLDYVLDALSRGFFVAPLLPRSKRPATAHGVLDATNDEAQIRRWWTENPDYNYLIALGPSGLVVWDFDKVSPFAGMAATLTVKTGRAEKDGVSGIQYYYRGTASTHSLRADGKRVIKANEPGYIKDDAGNLPIGERRGRGAYVVGFGSIHPDSGNRYEIISDVPLAESPEQDTAKPVVTGFAIGNDKQEAIADVIENAMSQAGVDFETRYSGAGGELKWRIACPWEHEHTGGKRFDSSSTVILWTDGKIIYSCKHAHCDGVRKWNEPDATNDPNTYLRHFIESKIGHAINFGEGDVVFGTSGTGVTIPGATTPATPAASCAPIAVADIAVVSDDLGEVIPDFDTSVITGIFKDIVDLVCEGTTIPRQFPFLVAKVYIGARMAGRVTFEGLDCDSSYYGAAIGETGTSKGLSWRRTMDNVFTIRGADGIKVNPQAKILYSADSGAGLKDVFFESPISHSVILYIDEVASLGHKTGEKKQPEIVDNIIELADTHVVSRVLAKQRGKTASRTTEARLSIYMCGQDGPTYTGAFAGRTKLGFYDRLYPEHSPAIEAGDLPDIDSHDVSDLWQKIERLGFEGHMTMAAGVKSRLDAFWNTQPVAIRKKVRFKKHIMLDMYLAAFGQGRKVAELEDLEAAIRIFTRQIVIRREYFTFEVPDRVGYYVGLIKKVTESMRARLITGEPIDRVAKSARDFQTVTHAYRDNEVQVFNIAWRNFQPDYLAKVKVTAANGHAYPKFVPIPNETETWCPALTD